MQGLTTPKMLELERLIENDLDIVCITETQLVYDKVQISGHLKKYDSMRGKDEQKGGGLLVMFKDTEDIQAVQKKTINKDILVLEARIQSTNLIIILVYVSLSDKGRQNSVQLELSNLIEKYEEETLILLGDFNGHIGFLGDQPINRNGKMILEWMGNNSMIMLNDDLQCEGMYTWSRNEQKSVIDYALCNKKFFDIYTSMKIDQEQEKVDISDHNLIEINFKVVKERNNKFRKTKWEKIEYYSTKAECLEKYAQEMENIAQSRSVNNISELNNAIVKCADNILKRTFRVKSSKTAKEAPWINEEIRKQIQMRKKFNRARRKAETDEERNRLKEKYIEQKCKVQMLIKNEIYKHEKKVTKEIKENGDKTKLWDYIRKLQGKVHKKGELKLFNEHKQAISEDEAEKDIKVFWKTVYQKHENKMMELWKDETRKPYTENYDTRGHIVQAAPDYTVPEPLREHMDMACIVHKEIRPMMTVQISREELTKVLKQLKNKKAAGPDKCKPEFYKALVHKPDCMEIMLNCFNEILETGNIPKEWRTSHTKMIPKTAKPTAKDLRPIALTNYTYKIFMAILKDKIEDHLRSSNEVNEAQAGFSKGARIEDNLLILQYCIEDSYTNHKALIVTSIDYTKAFDSIKREKIVETMMKYKVHPTIINTIANIYKEDNTLIKLTEDRQTEIPVTSGIRQGCTGSTTLFKLITYAIMMKLEEGRGFNNTNIHINSLFFADDGLLLSHSIDEAQHSIRLLTEISRECGLEINKNKSKIIIYNLENSPQQIENIQVCEEIKYLGLTLLNNRNIFTKQKKIMIEKAQKLANLTYSIIAKSCHKITVGKAYWKSVCLPSILYGANVINFTERDIQQLQIIENSVYRHILGAPRFAQTCTLRGEVGASSMKKRIMEGKLLYLKSIIDAYTTTTQENLTREEDNRNNLLKEVYKMAKGNQQNWIKNINKYLECSKLTLRDIGKLKKEEIKEKLRSWDTEEWKQEVQSKRSLELYKIYKPEIKCEELIYDNTPSSVTLYRARTNNLALNDRKRFYNEDTTCIMCGAEEENLQHFLLYCPGYQGVRRAVQAPPLPLPAAAGEHIAPLGCLLFTDAEKNKDNIHRMWLLREKRRQQKEQQATMIVTAVTEE